MCLSPNSDCHPRTGAHVCRYTMAVDGSSLTPWEWPRKRWAKPTTRSAFVRASASSLPREGEQ